MPKAKLDTTAADEAIRLLEAGDWNGGLAALNALWAAHRDPALAAEIERASAHAAKSSPAVGADQKDWEKACAAGSLVGLEHLLAVIRDGTAPNIRARFDRLLERDPDPRMTMIVPLFANELHLRSGQARAVWTAFFKLVAHTGDPRAEAGLAKLAALAKKEKKDEFAMYLVEQIAKVTAKLPEAGTYAGLAALKKQLKAVIAKPVKVVRKKASSGDSLYAAVLDNPGDLAARQVWADALLEAGDDRGTFVALQLAAETRPLTPAEQKQHDQLLAANRTTWLGDAGAAIEVKTATFRRGVLDSAMLSRKAKPKDLEAREFRTLAQLGAQSPELLAHDNLVSLVRIGRGFVPNPHTQTGLVGFDCSDGYGFGDWDEVVTLANQRHNRVTHLEMGLPQDCNVDVVKHAFPDLDTVSIGYSWSATKKTKTFEVLIPWLRGMRDVILDDLLYSNESDDGWFVERLPTTNVHVVFGGGELYRSYVRRDGKVHAVFTDTSTKPGFTDNGRRTSAEWMSARMGFFATMPKVESLTFRQRATWLQVDVDAVAEATKKLTNVTLPRARK